MSNFRWSNLSPAEREAHYARRLSGEYASTRHISKPHCQTKHDRNQFRHWALVCLAAKRDGSATPDQLRFLQRNFKEILTTNLFSRG